MIFAEAGPRGCFLGSIKLGHDLLAHVYESPELALADTKTVLENVCF
jgi:hypothetical protein